MHVGFVLFLFSCAYDECKRSRIVLALLSTGEAYVVDSRKEHRARVELCEALSEDDDDERARYFALVSALQPALTYGLSSIMTTARFDPSGRHVFVGTSTGNVLVFNSRMKIVRIPTGSLSWKLDLMTLKMVARHRIAGAGSMKSLEFAKVGR